MINDSIYVLNTNYWYVCVICYRVLFNSLTNFAHETSITEVTNYKRCSNGLSEEKC